jgi:hypothetical protein
MTAPTAPKNMDEIKALIKLNLLAPGEQSYNRKLLMEGLDNILKRIDYNTKLKEANNISLDIGQIGGGWIQHFIRDTLGGQFNCNTKLIEWKINDQTIEFNPFTGSIAYANRS